MKSEKAAKRRRGQEGRLVEWASHPKMFNAINVLLERHGLKLKRSKRGRMAWLWVERK